VKRWWWWWWWCVCVCVWGGGGGTNTQICPHNDYKPRYSEGSAASASSCHG
jgi:hypothetical protein